MPARSTSSAKGSHFWKFYVLIAVGSFNANSLVLASTAPRRCRYLLRFPRSTCWTNTMRFRNARLISQCVRCIHHHCSRPRCVTHHYDQSERFFVSIAISDTRSGDTVQPSIVASTLATRYNYKYHTLLFLYRNGSTPVKC